MRSLIYWTLRIATCDQLCCYSDKSYNNYYNIDFEELVFGDVKTLLVRHVKGIKGNNGGDSVKSNIGAKMAKYHHFQKFLVKKHCFGTI